MRNASSCRPRSTCARSLRLPFITNLPNSRHWAGNLMIPIGWSRHSLIAQLTVSLWQKQQADFKLLLIPLPLPTATIRWLFPSAPINSSGRRWSNSSTNTSGWEESSNSWTTLQRMSPTDTVLLQWPIAWRKLMNYLSFQWQPVSTRSTSSTQSMQELTVPFQAMYRMWEGVQWRCRSMSCRILMGRIAWVAQPSLWWRPAIRRQGSLIKSQLSIFLSNLTIFPSRWNSETKDRSNARKKHQRHWRFLLPPMKSLRKSTNC